MEGKRDDEAVREIEEQEEPKPNVIPSALQESSSKPSIIKTGAPSRDISRSQNAAPEMPQYDIQPKTTEEQVTMGPVPSEKISVPPSGQIFDVPTGPTSEGLSSTMQVPEAPVPYGGTTPSAAHLSESSRRFQAQPSRTKTASDAPRGSTTDKIKMDQELLEDFPADMGPKKRTPTPTGFVGCLAGGLPSFDNFSCSKFITKRSPFVHNPPRPEERRPRVERPRSPRDYIINLREDLADFQESHGLPRSRDYSFMSLGLALAQETARAICSVFLMFSELFPVIAIISLVLRFALDKLIDILETHEPVPKLKKTLIFCLQMVMILIPLWILIGTIVLPLAGLLFSIFRKLLRFKGGKSGRSCSYPKKQANPSGPKKIDPPKTKASSCVGSSG